MKPQRPITFLDSGKNRRRIRIWFYAALAVLLLVDFFVSKHGHFPWEEASGFYAAYGFIGCVALIFIAKGLRCLVRRDEDYYD